VGFSTSLTKNFVGVLIASIVNARAGRVACAAFGAIVPPAVLEFPRRERASTLSALGTIARPALGTIVFRPVSVSSFAAQPPYSEPT